MSSDKHLVGHELDGLRTLATFCALLIIPGIVLLAGGEGATAAWALGAELFLLAMCVGACNDGSDGQGE